LAKKLKRRKKKINYTLYFWIFLIVILILFAYYFSLVGIQAYPQGVQPTTPLTIPETELTGGYCENYQQCFIIGCKSKGVFQCLNTSQMNDFFIHYSLYCETYNDVQIKQRDLSFCACINNMCIKPK
jgi:hypothetical protein